MRQDNNPNPKNPNPMLDDELRRQLDYLNVPFMAEHCHELLEALSTGMRSSRIRRWRVRSWRAAVSPSTTRRNKSMWDH